MLDDIRRGLADRRRVVLWGPPGVGKSVLGRQALAGQLGDVRLVDDWDVSHAEAATEWDRIPEGQPVLITRRGRLALPGALHIEVPLLDHAAALERLRERVGGWSPDDDTAVSRVVEHIDGLALGLELLASQWEMLGPRGLAARLDDLDTTLVDPTAPTAKHRGLVALFDEAWTLLGPEARAAGCALACVRGTFDVADADHLLGGPSLPALRAVRDAGWLVSAGPGRFRFPQPVRRALLRRAPPDGSVHRAWVIANPGARDRSDVVAAAEDALVDGSEAEVLGLLEQLHRRAHPPGAMAGLYERAIERFGEGADLLGRRGRMHLIGGNLQAARRDLEAAEAMASTPQERAAVLRHFGSLGTELADRALAVDSFEAAVDLWQSVGDPLRAAMAAGELAMVHLHFAEHEAAAERMSEVIDVVEEAGDSYVHAHMLVSRAVLGMDRGRLADAFRDLDEADAIAQECDHAYARVYAGASRGLAELLADRPEAARRVLERTLEQAGDAGFRLLELRARMRLVAALAWLGDDTATRAEVRRVRAMLAAGTDATAPGVFDLILGLRDITTGRPQAAIDRLRAAATVDEGPALLQLDEEARMFQALLERRLPKAGTRSLRVGPDCAWLMRVDGELRDLTRFSAARRLLLRLVVGWEREPGVPVPRTDLFAAGWPADNIGRSSALNRLRVELSRLRRMGLRSILLTKGAGYLLDPETSVLRLDEPPVELSRKR